MLQIFLSLEIKADNWLSKQLGNQGTRKQPQGGNKDREKILQTAR